MVPRNSGLLLSENEYPRFNGKRITSIYAEYENSRYIKGAYIADVLFYKCYIHHWDVKDGKGEYIQVKELPEPFKKCFGLVNHNGLNVFIKAFSIRESDSANGSFIDQTLDFSGWPPNSTSHYISFYRNLECDRSKYTIVEGDEMYDNVLKIIGGKFKVEEIEFGDCNFKAKERTLDFATKFPYKHTPIQFIDGLAYPDEKLDSWRWLHGYPYRQPTGKIDRTTLRIWDSDYKVHLYVEKPKKSDINIGDELISVTFSYEHHEVHGSEGSVYCRIRRYNKSCEYAYCRYFITDIHKDGTISYQCYRNGEKLRGENGRASFEALGSLYHITRIVHSEQYKKEEYSR